VDPARTHGDARASHGAKIANFVRRLNSFHKDALASVLGVSKVPILICEVVEKATFHFCELSEIFESQNYKIFICEKLNFLSFAHVLSNITGVYSVSISAFEAGFPLPCLILVSGPSFAKSAVFCSIFPHFLCVTWMHASLFSMLCVAINHSH